MRTRSVALTLVLLSLVSGATISCHEEGPAERAGKAIDQAADDVGDAARDAGDAIDDAAEKAKDKIHDATD